MMSSLQRCLLAIAIVSSLASDARADTVFTNESLRGSWGFSAHGTITGVGAAVAVGVFTFDGSGGCTIADTLNIEGFPPLPPRESASCTYSVNANGTGSLTAQFVAPPPGEVPLSFVIVDSKKELRFIRTDFGAVALGVAKRQ